MKKTLFYITMTLLVLWFSFYTENLTEKKNREAMNTYNPEQLVEVIMRDSLEGLHQRSVTLDELSKAQSASYKPFAEKHGRVLGIGSPVTYVVTGSMTNVTVIDNEELQGMIDDICVRIPIKYVFGNTARDASGWFDISEFRNTMDFNAVSASMNKYIANTMQTISLDSVATLDLLGAIAVKDGILPPVVTIIPYEIKINKK